MRVDAEPHAKAAQRPTVVFRGELDLDADAFGETTSLPPFRNRYAGGIHEIWPLAGG